ncbi:thioredoxin domain-containing protein [Vibrio vulnificus]|nr:thioredoxin domain-containing protein [Vibrio vulnificus]
MILSIKIINNILKTFVFSLLAAVSFISNAHDRDDKYFEAIPMVTSISEESKIRVYYFFNSNCPSCKKFSPELEEWQNKMKGKIEMISVPFAPFTDWEWSSKAYLGGLELKPDLTRKEIEESQDALGIEQVTDLLKAADVLSVATGAKRGKIMTVLTMKKMNLSFEKMQENAASFGVLGTPSIVVIGRNAAYRVSPEFGLTHKGMLNITEALIEYQNSLRKANKSRE